MKAHPVRRCLKIIAVNLLLFTLFWGIIECLFYGKISVLGLSVPYSVTRVHDTTAIYPSSGKAYYTRDRHGLRGGYSSVEDIDILTIGGSTTDQRYIDDSATWQSVLARKLQARLNRDVSVVNAGVSGQSTLGHIYALEFWLPKIQGLKTKYILFYIGVNDIYIDKVSGSTDSRYREAADRPFYQKTVAYAVHKTLRGMYLAEKNLVGHTAGGLSPDTMTPVPEAEFDRLKAEREADLRAFTARLARLTEIAREMGAVPIFADQYVLTALVDGKRHSAPRGGEDYVLLKIYGQAMMNFCRENGLQCLETQPLFDAMGHEDFYDIVHTTPSGSKKIGDYFFEHLTFPLLQ